MRRIILRGALIAGLFLISAFSLSRCSNSPYRTGESANRTYFGYYDAPPTKLDPANSYYTHEAEIMDNLVEPPFDYHFLKRPYELIPLTAESVPRPKYYNRAGNLLGDDPPAGDVARAEYMVHIKPGILYSDHPCFARDAKGQPLYRKLTAGDVRHIETPYDFAVLGTRELTAEDYAFGIRRLADPRLGCPILSTLTRYVDGMTALGHTYATRLEAERARRRAAGGSLFSAELDEKKNPILLDYLDADFPGLQVLDRYTFKVVLTRKYPQILYWMAMHFFAPVPREAIEFYSQEPLVDKQLVWNRWPVGTGAFYLRFYEPDRQIILERNRRFREERYPSDGEPTDRANGFLNDAGKKIPSIDRAVLTLEKEAIPLWSKFLQGYYDKSVITAEAFERTITLSSAGQPSLSEEMRGRGVRMQSDVGTSIYWFAFNMLDDVVGGYTPARQKLRQAISIALDYSEYLDIFLNGQGISAQGVLPPGIFGNVPGEAGVNPYTDVWDPSIAKPVRRPIGDARKLLAEAGYPDGRQANGRPLTLYLDHASGGDPTFVTQFEWMRKRLRLIGIDLQERGTELKRFREKMDGGNFQLCRLGWLADYPDPENFLFLLYGPNAKYKTMGENSVNYENAEFDRLFEQMESMENGPARKALIDRLLEMTRRDAPMCWGFHPLLYGLYHEWNRNGKPHQMTKNTLKYVRIDPALRVRRQREWNRPRIAPVLALEAVLLLLLIPAMIFRRRQERTSTC